MGVSLGWFVSFGKEGECRLNGEEETEMICATQNVCDK